MRLVIACNQPSLIQLIAQLPHHTACARLAAATDVMPAMQHCQADVCLMAPPFVQPALLLAQIQQFRQGCPNATWLFLIPPSLSTDPSIQQLEHIAQSETHLVIHVITQLSVTALDQLITTACSRRAMSSTVASPRATMAQPSQMIQSSQKPASRPAQSPHPGATRGPASSLSRLPTVSSSTPMSASASPTRAAPLTQMKQCGIGLKDWVSEHLPTAPPMISARPKSPKPKSARGTPSPRVGPAVSQMGAKGLAGVKHCGRVIKEVALRYIPALRPSTIPWYVRFKFPLQLLVSLSLSGFALWWGLTPLFDLNTHTEEALTEWEQLKETATATPLPEVPKPPDEPEAPPPLEESVDVTEPVEPSFIGAVHFQHADHHVALFKGITPEMLDKGAGYDTLTAPVGSIGNSVIYGHREAVFWDIKDLKPGMTFTIETLDETLTYRVVETFTTYPSDKAIYQETQTNNITLVTCYPFIYMGPTPQRFVVRATLDTTN